MSSKVNEVTQMPSVHQTSACPAPDSATWIEYIPTPAWVTSPTGVLQTANTQAKRLCAEAEKPCSRYGQCVDNCFALRQEQEPTERIAKSAGKSEGRLMRLPTADDVDHSYQVFVSAYTPSGAEQPLILHVAFDVQRAQRIESYFQRIVERSQHTQAPQRPAPRLTKRETEIIDLLAEDETLWGIADKLCLSYCTVRNHVQHILAKFGVHSIIEAVAHYLTLPESTRQQVVGAATGRRRRIHLVGSANNSL